MRRQIIDIAGRKVGLNQPCFIIAEAGVNHNGDVELAKRLVDVAAKACVDVIKFQSFKAERLVTLEAPKAKYQLQTTGEAQTQYEMLRSLELSKEEHCSLMAYCKEKHIMFMSTPFEEESADLLDDLDVSLFKIPSGEITNLPFLGHVARKGKPIIISTGMSYLSEVEAAVRTIEKNGNCDIVLLHCVSSYPADPGDVNLRSMRTMSISFGLPVGYSDHTMGIDVALAAVALGASVIEKHITLDRDLPGPDHQASLEPDELQSLVQGIRKVEAALGHGRKEPAESEISTAEVARKSLVASRDIEAGTILTEQMIERKRPGTGLPPVMLKFVLARMAKVNIKAGTVISLEMLE